MAFISGYKTIYLCPLCKEELKWPLMSNGYEHSDHGIVFVNGYPQSCENNGKVLSVDEIDKINSPIITSDRRTMSY